MDSLSNQITMSGFKNLASFCHFFKSFLLLNYEPESTHSPQNLLAEHVSKGTNLAQVNSCWLLYDLVDCELLPRIAPDGACIEWTQEEKTMKRRQRGNAGCRATMRFLSSILVTMASSTSSAMGSSYDQPSRYSLDLGHRRLGEAAPNERHNSPPGRKRVKEEKEASRFSYYMTSDCRPRSSGFFGSTGGDPVLFEYGFELETTIFATMDKILNIISDKVMDEMISRTFSDMCGVHRRRVQDTAIEPTSSSSSVGTGKVTGFHFSAEEKVQSSKINL